MSSFLGQTGAVPKTGKKKTKAERQKSEMREAKADKSESNLWKRFSQFIRLRDCKIAYTNPKTDNYEPAGQCISCGTLKFFRDLECGHFISRRWKATKYDERNNSCQCSHCNNQLSGNVANYRINLIDKIGLDQVEELERIHRDITKKMDLATVKGLTAYYHQKIKDEAERLGVEPPK